VHLAFTQDQQRPTQSPLRHKGMLRRRLVAACFRPLLDKVDRLLCRPGQLPTRGIHRILVCRPNHRLGNTLLVSALLTEIESLYPGAEVDVVIGGHAGECLFTHRFQVRRFYSVPRRIARHLWATVRLLRELRSNTYDLAIDTCVDSQSGRLLLAIARARFKLGYPDERHLAASAWHGTACPDHLAQRSVFLLRMAYSGHVSQPYPPLSLRLQDAEKARARETLEAILNSPTPSRHPRVVVGIFPHATGAKRYSADWWARFIDKLLALQPDVQIVNLVAEHGENQLDDQFVSYYTRDLRHLGAMIACMDAFISADCGVMHLAAATGTPTLGLFASTCPTKYGPDGVDHEAIETRDMAPGDVAMVTADWLALTANTPVVASAAAASCPT